MKQYIKRLIIFFAIICVISIPLDLCMSHVCLRNTHYAAGESHVWHTIFTGGTSSDIIIMGSSRAWVHINPVIIDRNYELSTYNLGIDGHSLSMQIIRYEEYCKYNKQPKFIILSTDYRMHEQIELYNDQQFYPFMLFNWKLYGKLQKYKGCHAYEFALPVIRYCNSSFSILRSVGCGQINVKFRMNGYCGMMRKWNWAEYEKRIEFVKEQKGQIDEEYCKRLEEFCNMCKANGIRLIMVYSPIYKDSQQYIDKMIETRQKYKEIADAHGVPYLDYSDHPICGDTKYFYNALHLNSDGADLFTSILVEDMRQYIKQSSVQE